MTERVKMMKKDLNIYLTTFNRAEMLKDAIKSVLEQTYQNYDLYILDNCSSDKTGEVVASFSDSRIHYIRHEKNILGGGNINYALEHNDQEYFMICHDDDIMLPGMVQREIEYLKANPSTTLVSCQNQVINAEGIEIPSGDRKPSKTLQFRDGEFLKAYMSEQQYISFPTIMYRGKFVKENRVRIDPSVGPSADVKMCFEIERAGGTIAILPDALYCYRMHEGQDSFIHRSEMIRQLFNSMKGDSYYTSKISRKDERCYYRRMLYDEACLFGRKTITHKQMMIDERNFSSSIPHLFTDQLIFYLFCGFSWIFPWAVHGVYRAVKK